MMPLAKRRVNIPSHRPKALWQNRILLCRLMGAFRSKPECRSQAAEQGLGEIGLTPQLASHSSTGTTRFSMM